MSSPTNFNSGTDFYKIQIETITTSCRCRRQDSCDHESGQTTVQNFVKVSFQEAIQLREMGQEVYIKSGRQYFLYSPENPRATGTTIVDRSSSYTTTSNKCRVCFSRKQCNCEN